MINDDLYNHIVESEKILLLTVQSIKEGNDKYALEYFIVFLEKLEFVIANYSSNMMVSYDEVRAIILLLHPLRKILSEKDIIGLRSILECEGLQLLKKWKGRLILKTTLLEIGFQKNFNLLPERIKKQVRKVNKDDLWRKIQVSVNDKGLPTCKYIGTEGSFYLNGTTPIDEGEVLFEENTIIDATSLFIYGCDVGYPLFTLDAKRHSNTFVVIFEQNIYIFLAMLYLFDLEKLLKDPKVIFFVGDFHDISQEFQQFLLTGGLLRCTMPTCVFTNSAKRYFKKKYLHLHQSIMQLITFCTINIGNDPYDNLIGFHNLINNVNEIIENPYLSSFKNKFYNKPAFIVANGPSLDKNIEILKKIKDKGLMIAAGSSVIPLLKEEIKPDAMCILERTEQAFLHHFRGIEYPEELVLLGLAIIDKRNYQTFQGPRIPIFRSREAMNRWVNRFIGDESCLSGGSNVSHLAYEAAIYMGANPIIFVGQDFAFAPDGAHHSKKSRYYEGSSQSDYDKNKVVDVDSNDGKSISSTPLWTFFRKGLEEMIMNTPHITVINATEGGAKINGTTCMPLMEAIELYCKKPLKKKLYTIVSESKETINLKHRMIRLHDLADELDKYTHGIKSLLHSTQQGMKRCHEILNLCKKETGATLNELEEVLNKNHIDLQQFFSNDLFVYFFQQIMYTGYDDLNRLGNIQTVEGAVKALTVQSNWFKRLEIIAESLVESFIEAQKKLLNMSIF